MKIFSDLLHFMPEFDCMDHEICNELAIKSKNVNPEASILRGKPR